jgi:hypothetical protein
MLPTPGPELPKPERLTPQQGGGEYVVPYPEELEQASAGERISQASSAVAQAADATVIPLPLVDDTTQTVPLTDPAHATNPVIADDADVIEKEWVEKAKDIVSKTKTDPHLQSVQLTTFRHDYMKKRYGKEIKMPEDRAA